MEKKKTAKSAADKADRIDFEKALKQLEEIAAALEEGDLGLDESIRKFEQGMRLAKFCREKLDEAERKIEILQKAEGGKVAARQVEVDGESGEIANEDDLQGSLL
ncbi:MAG: exodeoxyribonuclease VII small subunit [Spirochaetes bacterium]|nr:exodeoxyribonuclease VII small subunit [Spirochaetota bacterium]